LNVKSGKFVLNLGCGEQTYGDVRVDIYRSKAANILADAEQFLPFRDDTFDEVYSSHFFEHLRNPSHGLNEMIRVLKPGGKLILITDNASYIPFHVPPKFGSGFHSWNGYYGVSPVDRHFALYTPEHLKNHLLDRKLQIVTIKYAYSRDVAEGPGGPFQKITRFLLLSKLLPILKPFIHPNILVVAVKPSK
jgi:ubiquinone/menaquinone biosynthesis C-methylase UbiE